MVSIVSQSLEGFYKIRSEPRPDVDLHVHRTEPDNIVGNIKS